MEIVDKLLSQLIITKKIYTRLLITPSPHVDIQWTKKIEKKLSTYQQYMLLLLSIFKERKEKIINIIK